MLPREIELLAPARDYKIGMAAITHGADAVYIGGPQFSARASAANSIDEIRRLIDYAHLFHARVYVAMNTLLTDREVSEALEIIHRLYEINADALIIQDMGLLECDLPPIPLHASTQTDNRTPEKVKFLQDVGFSRVVLARELNLEEISRIRAATSIPLEFFVHGALCVSYSGRCTFSEKVSGRSANRGRCAQFCRHSYSLKDGKGKILVDNAYLLSLQDLDLSGHLETLIASGINSLKIEGRLKDIDYVKNVTAFYRKTLDGIIDRDSSLVRASAGKCTFAFTPDPERTFHRSGCTYFLVDGHNRISAPNTPKSTGKRIGQVLRSREDCFTVESTDRIANGDGLCFFDGNGRLVGFRVNRVEGNRIFPREKIFLQAGTTLYRNFDFAFQALLKKSNHCRKIALTITVSETAHGIHMTLVDEDGCISSSDFALAKEQAKDPDMMKKSLKKQLAKSGETIFWVQKIEINIPTMLFLPVAEINRMRREALDCHLQIRRTEHTIKRSTLKPNSTMWPAGHDLPIEHRANKRAEAFFSRHGVTTQAAAPSRQQPNVLMTCKYCVKAELGFCKAVNQDAPHLVEPLTLSDKTGTYRLAFNCNRCEMQVVMLPGKKKSA